MSTTRISNISGTKLYREDGSLICLYTELGLKPDVAIEEVKKAYRKQALVNHPDKNANNPDALIKFKTMTDAYEILADSELLTKYQTERNAYQEQLEQEQIIRDNAAHAACLLERIKKSEQEHKENKLNSLKLQKQQLRDQYAKEQAQIQNEYLLNLQNLSMQYQRSFNSIELEEEKLLNPKNQTTTPNASATAYTSASASYTSTMQTPAEKPGGKRKTSFSGTESPKNKQPFFSTSSTQAKPAQMDFSPDFNKGKYYTILYLEDSLRAPLLCASIKYVYKYFADFLNKAVQLVDLNLDLDLISEKLKIANSKKINSAETEQTSGLKSVLEAVQFLIQSKNGRIVLPIDKMQYYQGIYEMTSLHISAGYNLDELATLKKDLEKIFFSCPSGPRLNTRG